MNKIWIGVTTAFILSIPASPFPLAAKLPANRSIETVTSLAAERDRSRSCLGRIGAGELNCTLASNRVIHKPQPGSKQTINLSQIERGIIVEMNRARSNPPAYRQVLVAWRGKFNGKKVRLSDRLFLQTHEGTPAVDEALKFLQKTRPVGTLSLSKGLTLAARDHVRDQGTKGATGHNSSNGNTPFQRMERYGQWQKIAGENIAYGPDTAQAVVRDLIIDDGVADRGHRTNIFQPQFLLTGVACGYHRRYRVMCDLKYAGGLSRSSLRLFDNLN